MPQEPLCTSSHLSLQWAKESEKQALEANPESGYL